MKHLFLYVTQHINNHNFRGIVRTHSQNVNIQYLNDNPIDVEISNVRNNHPDLVNKVVNIVLNSENPVRGNLVGYVTEEADIIIFTT